MKTWDKIKEFEKHYKPLKGDEELVMELTDKEMLDFWKYCTKVNIVGEFEAFANYCDKWWVVLISEDEPGMNYIRPRGEMNGKVEQAYSES